MVLNQTRCILISCKEATKITTLLKISKVVKCMLTTSIVYRLDLFKQIHLNSKQIQITQPINKIWLDHQLLMVVMQLMLRLRTNNKIQTLVLPLQLQTNLINRRITKDWWHWEEWHKLPRRDNSKMDKIRMVMKSSNLREIEELRVSSFEQVTMVLGMLTLENLLHSWRANKRYTISCLMLVWSFLYKLLINSKLTSLL